MPGKANRNLASCVDEGDALVFSWARRHPGIFWLWGFLVLSLLLHATGFYLFQVVYPSSGRLEPFPAQVLILDKKNVANSVLLQELDDRLVFLQPASTDSESRKGIEDFTVSFQPSFADRAPPFREPVAPGEMTPAPRSPAPPTEPDASAPTGSGEMRRTAATAPTPRPAKGEAAPLRSWSLAGALSERSVTASRANNLDDALAAIGAAQGMVLDMVVSASGEILQATVNNGAGHPAGDEIVAVVKKLLKFEPITANHSSKGELRIH